MKLWIDEITGNNAIYVIQSENNSQVSTQSHQERRDLYYEVKFVPKGHTRFFSHVLKSARNSVHRVVSSPSSTNDIGTLCTREVKRIKAHSVQAKGESH